MSDRSRTISQIVAEMSVVSEVASSKHDVERVHGGEPNRAPKGPKLSMAEEHAQNYRQAKTPAGREHARRMADDALKEARQRRLPTDLEQAPEYGSPMWKRWVAASKLDGGTLARRFSVTRQYIHQIRQAYNG